MGGILLVGLLFDGHDFNDLELDADRKVVYKIETLDEVVLSIPRLE